MPEPRRGKNKGGIPYPFNFTEQLRVIFEELAKLEKQTSRENPNIDKIKQFKRYIQSLLAGQETAPTENVTDIKPRPVPSGDIFPPRPIDEEFQQTTELSQEALNSFDAWFKETYGLDISAYPDLAAFYAGENNPYYTYWSKNVWARAHPNQQPPPPGKTADEATSRLSLPPTMKIGGADVPVNYLNIGAVTIVEKDRLGNSVETDVNVYIPVPPPGSVSALDTAALAQNVYALKQDGTFYNEGNPLPPEKLSEIGFSTTDPLTGKVTVDPAFAKRIFESSVKGYMKDVLKTTPVGDANVFLEQYVSQLQQGSPFDPDYLKRELEKFAQFPEYGNILRVTGQLPGELPAYWDRADRQMAEAFAGALQRAGEGRFESEIEKLQARIKGLSGIVSEWQPKFKAGIYDPRVRLPTVTSQIAAAAMESTRLAQERLAAIERGEAQPVTRTTAGSEIPSFMVKQAQEQEIPLKNLAGLSRQFSDNPQSPEFANLTPQQRDTLRVIGLESQGEGADADLQRQQEQQRLKGLAAQQNPQWSGLVKRAREAQRRVSI